MSKPAPKPAPSSPAAAAAPPLATAVSQDIAGLDGAKPTRPMTLTGVVRTSKGFAVAVATFGLDGTLVVKLGNSQSEKQFVAHEHAKNLARLANSI